MEIRKCLNTDINDVYDLICQLEEKNLIIICLKKLIKVRLTIQKIILL